ncbi:MarR family transcriptional regulator [Mycetocola tolaasinivorans]|uniref:MarR family transcriptional regulator n=1 Tax=Mycetocola tolaasinivorans TaxID=76635 RepID=A0A3L7ADC4_9MICO|nr:MarR family transcriptional regulator [Mycetocola tolaasinivorans]RLP78015.1 MarR family transcriptional regulator [Mycetocola tolaasinivorans]
MAPNYWYPPDVAPDPAPEVGSVVGTEAVPDASAAAGTEVGTDVVTNAVPDDEANGAPDEEPDGNAQGGAVGVLRALRRWRECDESMRRATRRDMGLGETDMAALRYLIASAGRDESVTAKRLAEHLGISSASTTKLTDRLEASGHLRRLPHPDDRRAILLEVSERTHREVRSTLGGRHERMFAAANALSDSEQVAVIRFLDRIGAGLREDDVAVTVAAGPTAGSTAGSPQAIPVPVSAPGTAGSAAVPQPGT